MPARALQPGEHVVIADGGAVLLDVHERAVDLEQRHHLLAPFRHHQRVRLARRLEGEAALFGDPVVLEVVPPALEDVREHRARVPVAGDDPLARDAHDVRVLPCGHVEVQRPRPHAVAERDPEPVVGRPDVRDHEVGTHVVRLGPEIGLGAGVATT